MRELSDQTAHRHGGRNPPAIDPRELDRALRRARQIRAEVQRDAVLGLARWLARSTTALVRRATSSRRHQAQPEPGCARA